MYVPPGALVAVRDLVVDGTTIAAGTELTAAQIESFRKIEPLLSNGSIAPAPDTYGRRTRSTTPQPTYINPGAREVLMGILEGVTVTVAASDPEDPSDQTAVITITGRAPFTVAWGDGDTDVVSGLTASHTYVDYSSWIITVTDPDGDEATVSFTAVAPEPDPEPDPEPPPEGGGE